MSNYQNLIWYINYKGDIIQVKKFIVFHLKILGYIPYSVNLVVLSIAILTLFINSWLGLDVTDPDDPPESADDIVARGDRWVEQSGPSQLYEQKQVFRLEQTWKRDKKK